MPEVLLQRFDLMTDRRLGDEQLARGIFEAEMPGGGLEGTQLIEIGQAPGHQNSHYKN